MDEFGIDLSTAFPKKLTTDAVKAADRRVRDLVQQLAPEQV